MTYFLFKMKNKNMKTGRSRIGRVIINQRQTCKAACLLSVYYPVGMSSVFGVPMVSTLSHHHRGCFNGYVVRVRTWWVHYWVVPIIPLEQGVVLVRGR